VIAHRLSTIINADKISVFDDGRIVDIGRHEELIERDGMYRDLFEKQFRSQVNGTRSRCRQLQVGGSFR